MTEQATEPITKQPESDNICSTTKPMAEWLKEETKQCRPCILGPVVDWYLTELEEQGKAELAQDMKETVDKLQDNSEASRIGELMDEIKEKVGEGALRDRLKEFDCTVQNYHEGEEAEAEGETNEGEVES